MPAYDFICPDCGITRTVTRSVHDDTPVKCGLSVMKRLYNAVPAVFKGSGWACKE